MGSSAGQGQVLALCLWSLLGAPRGLCRQYESSRLWSYHLEAEAKRQQAVLVHMWNSAWGGVAGSLTSFINRCVVWVCGRPHLDPNDCVLLHSVETASVQPRGTWVWHLWGVFSRCLSLMHLSSLVMSSWCVPSWELLWLELPPPRKCRYLLCR